MAWDGIDRRKKPKWSFPKQFTWGEIITVALIGVSIYGTFKDMEAKQVRTEERLDRLERLLCYSLKQKDGVMPAECQR